MLTEKILAYQPDLEQDLGDKWLAMRHTVLIDAIRSGNAHKYNYY